MLNSKYTNAVVILAGILLIGLIDYFTGTEVRTFALYFLPLIFAATQFGKRGALGASILATFTWFTSNFWGGLDYSAVYIWFINCLTQFCVFITVALLVASLRDTLEREQALSRTDTLTGLLNIRAFNEQGNLVLALSRRNQRPVTLAFMDLDNFKQVNDSAGHHQGDELLKTVAGILVSHLRASDLIARIGGDEFTLLLPETDEQQAHQVLHKLKEQLVQAAECKRFGVSASIGAIVYNDIPNDLQPMLKAADTLMYTVKAAGKNSIRIASANSNARAST